MNYLFKKPDKVRELFDRIAKKYDFFNSLFSFGLHYYWKNRTIKFLDLKKSDIVADLACGTADLAIMLSQKTKKVYAVDFSGRMINVAERKIKKRKIENIELVEGDIIKIDFPEKYFDAIFIGFGIRNVEDVEKFLRESFRILKPGGKLVILDFFKPKNRLIKFFYRVYIGKIMVFFTPFLGLDKNVCKYLLNSIENFYSSEDLRKALKKAGFENIIFKDLSFGIVTLAISINSQSIE